MLGLSGFPAGAAVYANIPWNAYMEASIDVNGIYTQKYAMWLSPSVFYIPVGNEDTTASLTLTSSNSINISDRQFYYVDETVLEKATNITNSCAPESFSLSNGNVECTVTSQDSSSLVLTIPDSEGWVAMVNGKTVEIEQFADYLMSIPLEDGENKVTLTYCLPGMKLGILITALGVIGTLLSTLMINKENRSGKNGRNK